MDILRDGKDGIVVTYGGMAGKALEISARLAKEGLLVAVVNMPCVKEIDETVMSKFLGVPLIVTYEDHNVDTGIAPRIASYLLKQGYRGRMESFGVKQYGVSGEAEEAYLVEGLDVASMTDALRTLLK
jgi:transketolase